jgi:hypothetical protein
LSRSADPPLLVCDNQPETKEISCLTSKVMVDSSEPLAECPSQDRPLQVVRFPLKQARHQHPVELSNYVGSNKTVPVGIGRDDTGPQLSPVGQNDIGAKPQPIEDPEVFIIQ